MATSRVERFKDYRNSLIKEGSVEAKSNDKNEKKVSSTNYETTSTLPIDEVIQNVSNEDREAIFIQKEKRRRILQIVITAAIVTVLIAGIIIFAVLVWG